MENPYESPRSVEDAAAHGASGEGADVFTSDARRRRRLRWFILVAYCAMPLFLLTFVVWGWVPDGEWSPGVLLVIAGLLSLSLLLFVDHWWPIVILATSSGLQSAIAGLIYLVSHDIDRANGGTLILLFSVAGFISIVVAGAAHARNSL